MGVKTEYICDNCAYTQDRQQDPKQMWYIHIGWGTNSWNKDLQIQKLWCRDCMDKYTLTPVAKGEPEPVPVTFEELIRTLIKDELENAK